MASQLKNQIKNDVDNVIFSDFGEMHSIDGKVVEAIVEKDTSKLMSDRFRNGFDGVYESFLMIHVRTADLLRLPPEGETITVDGIRYNVISSTDDCGLAILTVGADVG